MNTVPDRVDVDMRANEARTERTQARWAAHEVAAREILQERLLRADCQTRLGGPQISIDETLDVLMDHMSDLLDWQAWRSALCTEDASTIGAMVLRARDLAVNEYIESTCGQNQLAYIVATLIEE